MYCTNECAEPQLLFTLITSEKLFIVPGARHDSALLYTRNIYRYEMMEALNTVMVDESSYILNLHRINIRMIDDGTVFFVKTLFIENNSVFPKSGGCTEPSERQCPRILQIIGAPGADRSDREMLGCR